jgi:hypothetical protein
MSRVFTVEFKYKSNFYTGLITELINARGDVTYRVSLFDEGLRRFFPMGSIILRIVRGEESVQPQPPAYPQLIESITTSIRSYIKLHPVAVL